MFIKKRRDETYREILAVKDQIILEQQRTIALKNETIAVQQDHIDHLKGNR